jgi:hypothetical protein
MAATLTASGVGAQPSPTDPIGALLDPSTQSSPAPTERPATSPAPDQTAETPSVAPVVTDAEQAEPDPVAEPEPPAVAPPAAPWSTPAAPAPSVQAPAPTTVQPAPWAPPPRPPAPVWTPPRPQTTLDAPVHIDEIDRTPEGPPSPVDLSYEARLRASFAAAQGLQGPLDGRWTLGGADGDLYDLQLVDSGSAPVEGVWRDLRRPAALEATGFLADIVQTGGRLTFRFQPRAGGEWATATLVAGVDGRWSGELDDAGRRHSVTLRRN